jgi:hypothetical protein
MVVFAGSGVLGYIILLNKALLTHLCLLRAKDDVERNSLLTTTTMAGNAVAAEEKKGKTVKAALYGVQVFYSFFIM